MASNRWDFKPWPGIQYVIDPDLPPDHFYCDPMQHVIHVGAGTDLQLRLFYPNLTDADLKWLKKMFISLGNK